MSVSVCDILTIIFVVAKILGYIDWSWVYVFAPAIIEWVVAIIIIIARIIVESVINK